MQLPGTAAESFVAEKGVQLVMAMLTPHSSAACRLTAAGYSHSADILYLTCQRDFFPDAPPDSPLVFEPLAARDEQRLIPLVERTYKDTCDCPALNGVRETADVIEGYRHTGDHRPENWFFVGSDGKGGRVFGHPKVRDQ